MTVSDKDKKISGIVVESYNHDRTHLIIVVRACDAKNYFFFYTKSNPEAVLGDFCQIDFPAEEFLIIRYNDRQKPNKFKLDLDPWPGTLLLEVMSERIDL